jgi:hypothetical protein
MHVRRLYRVPHILDYKFIKEPLERRVTTTDLLKYKMMSGPVL